MAVPRSAVTPSKTRVEPAIIGSNVLRPVAASTIGAVGATVVMVAVEGAESIGSPPGAVLETVAVLARVPDETSAAVTV
jgi:hypothetical protein